MTDAQILEEYAQVAYTVAPAPAQVLEEYAQVAYTGAAVATLDQVNVQALVQGASAAQLDQVNAQVLVGFKMDVLLDAQSVEALIPLESVGVAERPWYPTTMGARTMQLHLKDGTLVLEKFGWGIVL